jgi:hypothetical protein
MRLRTDNTPPMSSVNKGAALILRCQEKKTEVAYSTKDTYLGHKPVTIRFRINSQDPIKEIWRPSMNGHEYEGADRWVFGTAPGKSPPCPNSFIDGTRWDRCAIVVEAARPRAVILFAALRWKIGKAETPRGSRPSIPWARRLSGGPGSKWLAPVSGASVPSIG